MSDLLAKTAVEGNVLDRISKLEHELVLLKQREVRAGSLDEISDDLGLVQAGEFRAGNGAEPDEGFCGIRILYPPITIDGKDYCIAGFQDDVMKFAISSDDGSAIFAAGNGVLDETGIKISGLLTALKMEAWNGNYGAIGRLSMETGVTTPLMKLSLEEVATIGNLITSNPGAETGDITGWTGSGTATSEDKNTGTWSFLVTSSFSLVSDRYAVTATATYLFSIWAKNRATGGSALVTINWYNAPSGGSLLRTDTFGGSGGTWRQHTTTKIAPVGATYVAITIGTNTPPPGIGSPLYQYFVDDCSITVTSALIRTIGFEPDITIRQSPIVVDSLSAYPSVPPTNFISLHNTVWQCENSYWSTLRNHDSGFMTTDWLKRRTAMMPVPHPAQRMYKILTGCQNDNYAMQGNLRTLNSNGTIGVVTRDGYWCSLTTGATSGNYAFVSPRPSGNVNVLQHCRARIDFGAGAYTVNSLWFRFGIADAIGNLGTEPVTYDFAGFVINTDASGNITKAVFESYGHNGTAAQSTSSNLAGLTVGAPLSNSNIFDFEFEILEPGWYTQSKTGRVRYWYAHHASGNNPWYGPYEADCALDLSTGAFHGMYLYVQTRGAAAKRVNFLYLVNDYLPI
jgi:hypothetical protein